jgi:hypothetical protein
LLKAWTPHLGFRHQMNNYDRIKALYLCFHFICISFTKLKLWVRFLLNTAKRHGNHLRSFHLRLIILPLENEGTKIRGTKVFSRFAETSQSIACQPPALTMSCSRSSEWHLQVSNHCPKTARNSENCKQITP